MANDSKQAPVSADDYVSEIDRRAEYREEFGRRLKALMLRKELSPSDLADAARLGRSNLSKYLHGVVMPRPPAMERLCKVLGVTDADLLPETATNTPVPAIELRQLTDQPGMALLRVNRRLPFDIAVQIIALINEADKREAGQG